MNKTTIRLIVAVLIILLFIPSLVAQDKEKTETPYWYVSFLKIPYAKIDSLYKLEKQYTPAVVAEAKKQGLILDYKMLLHHTGDEYNVVYLAKYPSFEAMESAWGWWNTAYKAIEPDEKKREKVQEARLWAFDKIIHKDLIYTEVE